MAASQSSTYKFKLNSAKPSRENAGGAVTHCDKSNFPIVEEGGAALTQLRLQPGGLREPHWHPNCWEMGHVIKGTVEMTIVAPDSSVETFTLEPGDVSFVPQGYAHSIINLGDEEAIVSVVFNHAMPTDIGLATMYHQFPDGQFAQTFGVSEADMAKIPKPPNNVTVIAKS